MDAFACNTKLSHISSVSSAQTRLKFQLAKRIQYNAIHTPANAIHTHANAIHTPAITIHTHAHANHAHQHCIPVNWRMTLREQVTRALSHKSRQLDANGSTSKCSERGERKAVWRRERLCMRVCGRVSKLKKEHTHTHAHNSSACKAAHCGAQSNDPCGQSQESVKRE